MDAFTNAIQKLAQDSFVTLTRDKVFPTPKFLISLKKAKTITSID